MRFPLALACLAFFLLSSAPPLPAQPGTWTISDDQSSLSVVYRKIACSDPQNCLALGWITNSSTFLRRSTDGGMSWETIVRVSEIPAPPVWQTFAVPDRQTIVAGDDSGDLHVSRDAGETWTVVQTPFERSIKHVEMLDDQYGVAYSYHALLITKDGWESFERIDLSNAISSPNLIADLQIHAIDDIVICNNQIFARTRDGGETWQETTLAEGGGWSSLDFVNATTGWMAGTRLTGNGSIAADLIQRTDDGGLTWTTQLDSLIEVPAGLTQIDFADERCGIAVGRALKMLHTTDGGETWTRYPFPDPLSDEGAARVTFLLSLAYPGDGLALAGSNNAGLLLRFDQTTSGGIADAEDDRSAVLLYPNPATDKLWLRLPPNDRIQTIRMVDATGKTVRKLSRDLLKENSGGLIALDVQDIPSGSYVIHISGESISLTKSVAIIR